ncbi:hypothetical protein Tco_0900282 [Tanacetum coccineum]
MDSFHDQTGPLVTDSVSLLSGSVSDENSNISFWFQLTQIFTVIVIMEYLAKISKKARILELKRRHLKITVLTSNTPYPSRKIRHICACTSQKTTKETRSIRRRKLQEEGTNGGETGTVNEQNIELTMSFPMSLTGAASRWLRSKPSGSITTWEDLKIKFLSKYCPPARTTKKIEEINNFQQKSDETLYQVWERFKELLMKCPQHYLTEMQEVILFYNGLDVQTRQILNSKGAIPSKTAADAKGPSTQKIAHSKKKVKPSKRLTTLNLLDLSKEEDIEQHRAKTKEALIKNSWRIKIRANKQDFIILDMPEDVKVPLIIGRPFLSTAHAKIDVFKRKITLRVGMRKLRRDQVDDLMPTIEEGEGVLQFYNEGQMENMDGYQDQDMGDITLGEPFCKASCVEARRFDGLITIHNGCDNVTYQMVRSHPRFKHLFNAQCNKIKPLLNVSVHDKLSGIWYPYQKRA